MAFTCRVRSSKKRRDYVSPVSFFTVRAVDHTWSTVRIVERVEGGLRRNEQPAFVPVERLTPPRRWWRRTKAIIQNAFVLYNSIRGKALVKSAFLLLGNCTKLTFCKHGCTVKVHPRKECFPDARQATSAEGEAGQGGRIIQNTGFVEGAAHRPTRRGTRRKKKGTETPTREGGGAAPVFRRVPSLAFVEGTWRMRPNQCFVPKGPCNSSHVPRNTPFGGIG